MSQAIETQSTNWKSPRARVASLTRSRTPDDPDLVQARRDLAAARQAARVADAVRVLVATAPPLTETQRAELAALLRGGAR